MKLAGEQEQQRILARATITPGRKAGCLCAVVEICGYAEESCRLQRFNLRTRCLAIASGRLGTYIRNRAWTLVEAGAWRRPSPDWPATSAFSGRNSCDFKLHYDGWLVLPAGLRRTLDLNSGDRLVAELVDGTIVLRPVNGQRATAEPKQAVEPLPSPRRRHLRSRRPCRSGGRVVGQGKCRPSGAQPKPCRVTGKLPCPRPSASPDSREKPSSKRPSLSWSPDLRPWSARAGCGSCGRRRS